MKNRYTVVDGIITCMDGAHTCATPYFTDENLQCQHESGEPLYKVDKGKHVLRSQAELESGEKYKEWANQPVLAKMTEIDEASIAEIRKWIAGKADASAALKNLEQEYQAEKGKLK